MRRCLRQFAFTLTAVVLTASTLMARPLYLKTLKTHYSFEAAQAATCTACHVGPKGANRVSDYSRELARALNGKNVRNPQQITDAMRQVEFIEWKDKVTYGSFFKQKRLPPPP